MKKLSFVLLLASAIAVPASAQTKISGKQTCPKPDVQQSADVTDMPGHALILQKGTCTWDTPVQMAGLKSVSSVDVSTAEAWGPNVTQHGYSTSTMDNGDTFTAKYSGTMKIGKDGAATFSGSWTFIAGTGKLKGLKGGGTYGGTGTADGAGTIAVKGDYTIVKAAASPTMKPAQ
ncbi:MAG: hypothetical protein WA871_08265 [Candidatus Acidiferrales bacterium]